jgi:hypothetical protein
MKMCTLNRIIVHIAIRRKNKELVDVLLHHGANINARLAEIVKRNDNGAIGSIALCFAVWFVTNFVKGVHEDEEIERVLDILEMLMASLTKFVNLSVSKFCFQGAEKTLDRLRVLAVKDQGEGSDSHIRYIDALKRLWQNQDANLNKLS